MWPNQCAPAKATPLFTLESLGFIVRFLSAQPLPSGGLAELGRYAAERVS